MTIKTEYPNRQILVGTSGQLYRRFNAVPAQPATACEPREAARPVLWQYRIHTGEFHSFFNSVLEAMLEEVYQDLVASGGRPALTVGADGSYVRSEQRRPLGV